MLPHLSNSRTTGVLWAYNDCNYMIYINIFILFPLPACKKIPSKIAECVLKKTHTLRTEVILQRFCP